MNGTDMKVIGAGSAGYITSLWHSVEPVLQAIIIICTAGYVGLRFYKEIRNIHKSSDKKS